MKGYFQHSSIAAGESARCAGCKLKKTKPSKEEKIIVIVSTRIIAYLPVFRYVLAF